MANELIKCTFNMVLSIGCSRWKTWKGFDSWCTHPMPGFINSVTVFICAFSARATNQTNDLSAFSVSLVSFMIFGRRADLMPTNTTNLLANWVIYCPSGFVTFFLMSDGIPMVDDCTHGEILALGLDARNFSKKKKRLKMFMRMNDTFGAGEQAHLTRY